MIRSQAIVFLLSVWFGLFMVFPSFAADIHDAALNGDLVKVKALLKSDPKLLEASGNHGKKPLHYAAQGGHMEMVAFLLEQGAAVDIKNEVNETPLQYAAAFGKKEVVEFLLSKGAELNAKTQFGNSAAYAAMRGNYDILEYLINKGADIMVKDEDGTTLLHFCAIKGSKELISFLIKKGIPVDGKTIQNRTPLHFAVMGGNLDGVNVLIQEGADVNFFGPDEGNDYWHPLTAAARDGNIEILQALIKAGAAVNFKQKKTQLTPLHVAALKGYGKVVALLLDAGAEPNPLDSFQKTPLYYACKYSHKTAAKALLNKGGNGVDMEKIKANFSYSPLLEKKFDAGEAVVWYLGHSGWAIKTSNHLLVFDYWKRNSMADTPMLANGSILPDEIKNLNVTVFVSHAHGDHYMESIFEWKKVNPNVTYVMGFKPENKPADLYNFMSPRETKKINGLEITTIESNDSGVGFFVTADNVNIFHSGDHANRQKDFSGPFTKEIDFLAEKGLKPDIFFAPVSGCGFGDLEAVRKGVYYTVKKLSPKTIFPMHGGESGERYLEFREIAIKEGVTTPIYAPMFPGDWFFSRQGEIKKASTCFSHDEKKESHEKKSCKASSSCKK